MIDVAFKQIHMKVKSGWVSSVKDYCESVEMPQSASSYRTKVYMCLDPLSGSLVWEGGGSVRLTQDTRVEKVDETSLKVSSGDGKGRERTILFSTSEADGALRCGEWASEIQRLIANTTIDNI